MPLRPLTIMSAATVFDIAFNAVFGSIIAAFGCGLSMLLLPLGMVLAFVCFMIFVKTKKAAALFIAVHLFSSAVHRVAQHPPPDFSSC